MDSLCILVFFGAPLRVFYVLSWWISPFAFLLFHLTDRGVCLFSVFCLSQVWGGGKSYLFVPPDSVLCLASCLGKRYWDIFAALLNRDSNCWKKKCFLPVFVLKAATVAKLSVIFLSSCNSLSISPRRYSYKSI